MWSPYIFLEKLAKVSISSWIKVFYKHRWNFPLFFCSLEITYTSFQFQKQRPYLKLTAVDGLWIVTAMGTEVFTTYSRGEMFQLINKSPEAQCTMWMCMEMFLHYVTNIQWLHMMKFQLKRLVQDIWFHSIPWICLFLFVRSKRPEVICGLSVIAFENFFSF